MDVNRAFPASPETATRPRVLLVANRLPYSLARERDGWTWKENAGGVAVGLRSVARQVDCLWIGAASQPLEDVSEGIGDLERTRLFALGGDRARGRDSPIHNVKQRSLLRSRGALLRPGFACLCSIHPHEGRAERRKAQVFCCRAFRRATIRTWR